MTKVSVLSQTGASVGEIELNDEIFGIEPNEAVLFDASHCSTRFTTSR